MRSPGLAFMLPCSALLLALAAACADQPVTPRSRADGEQVPLLSAAGRGPRDVPAVRIDLPPVPRPWDRDPAALADAVAAGGGYAVVAFKEPGNGRALATGNRGAVTAGTIRAGLQLLAGRGVEVVELLENLGAARVRIAPEAAAALAPHPLVDFVEPRQHGSLQALFIPWGIAMVRAPEAWPTTKGAGAKLMIIDTGHQRGHPDLPLLSTANCAGAYGGCDDGGTWHGTHVFGIARARKDTVGVVGVSPAIAVGDMYVYGACDSGTNVCPTDQVTAGINWAVTKGVDVVNLSLRQPYDAAQATAVAQAWSSGIVLVAAAGNDLSNTVIYPAGHPNVVGVSGVRSDETFASSSPCGGGHYSNYGPHVDLAAPFEAYSTVGGGYGTLCGTSMAAPHVAGAAALVRSRYPTWTNQQVVDQLFAAAKDRGPAGWDPSFGYGIVDAEKAIGPALPPPPPPPLLPPAANITGPTNISTAGSYTWESNASGGNGTYTFQWQKREWTSSTWSSLGTGSGQSLYIHTTEDFMLRVLVTSAGVTRGDSISVFSTVGDGCPRCGEQ